MKIAISGMSGLIGMALSEQLSTQGYQTIPIRREDVAKGASHVSNLINGVTAVVNLAGAPVLRRWTNSWKNEIYNSRVVTTKTITEAIGSMERPPGIIVSASAVGIYSKNGEHDDNSTNYGHDFLSDVCIDWEAAAREAESNITRVVIMRMGVVLANNGGALKQMLMPFRLGLGGNIASGFQPFPWVHVYDATRALSWVINNKGLKGVFNLVAPGLVSNREFTKALSLTLAKPALIPVPALALKILYGEASTILTAGQRVIPHRLMAEGFNFNFPDVESALNNLLKNDLM